MLQSIKNYARPFDSIDDLDPLMEDIGDAKYVLLGESSHGTSEYYTIRAELSKRLIKEKGFSVIAVEGDWPSCQSINRYIKTSVHHLAMFERLLKALIVGQRGCGQIKK